MKRLGLFAYATTATIFAVIAGAIGSSSHKVVLTQLQRVPVGQENLYIRNLDPKDFSDQEILRDIPAWERAVNVDFASYWHTTQYKIIFIGREQAPQGAITAEFVKKGPVKGALAYHWTERNNAPSITVYSGTGAYYGYDNSVSFTHELEELAADPVTANLNLGYPADYFYVQKPSGIKIEFNTAIGWFGEVSDPVESDWYTRPGADGKPVKISDFVTPSWFNDGVGGTFDFMGLCQQPFWIRPGGYAQFLDANGWEVVLNFRKGHPSDRGFYVQDNDRRALK